MPTIDGPEGRQFSHYNASDPDDLRELIETGLVWRGPAAARRLAVEALASGRVPMNDRVPEDVRVFIEGEEKAE